MKSETFTAISIVLSVGAYLPYVRAILTDPKVVPNLAGWVVWLIVDACMAVALWSVGAHSSAMMFMAFTAGSTLVILLSFKKSEGSFTLTEKIYVGIAILGVILWQVSADKNPTISVIANVVAMFMGGLPTVKKSFFTPQSEDPLTWSIFFCGGMFNTLAITKFDFVNAGATLFVWGLQSAILIALYLGNRREKASR